MASDWVAVAAKELSQFPEYMVRHGLKKARLEATHHGQIIPLCLKHGQQFAPWDRLSDYTEGRKSARQLSSNSEAQKLIESAAKGCKA